VAERQVDPDPTLVPAAATASPQPHTLAVAVEGTWPGRAPDTRPFRAVIMGDADFASNSFFPYMANSDLALAIIRWLVHEERTPTVASRLPVPPLILLTRLQMRQIFLIVEILLPLGVLVIGAIVWWIRR
jgi:hypothetical protein